VRMNGPAKDSDVRPETGRERDNREE
jgi:hypothetical protein